MILNKINKINPIQFHDYYHYPSNLHNTAANRNNNLNTPSVRTTTYGLKSLKYAGTVLWNNLPTSVRYMPSSKLFIKTIKEHFKSYY